MGPFAGQLRAHEGSTRAARPVPHGLQCKRLRASQPALQSDLHRLRRPRNEGYIA